MEPGKAGREFWDVHMQLLGREIWDRAQNGVWDGQIQCPPPTPWELGIYCPLKAV